MTKIPAIAIVLTAASLALVHAAFALDANRHLTQYAHNSWTFQDGYITGAVNAIAQTNDGYLWIGSEAGLIRFDGVRFQPWTPPKLAVSGAFPVEVSALLADRGGGLWLAGERTRGHPYLSHWTGHDLVSLALDAPSPPLTLLEARNGDVWIDSPFCQVQPHGLRCPQAKTAEAVSGGNALEEDAAGNIWFGGYTGVSEWNAGGMVSFMPIGPQNHTGQRGVSAIVAAPDGSIWVGIDARGPHLGLQHFNKGQWTSVQFPGEDSSEWLVNAMLLDRHGALWIGTEYDGVYRLYSGRLEKYRRSDGLSADQVNKLYEDREGNIWIGTPAGLDRFRDTQVVSLSMREGLCTSEADAVLSARDGTLWIGGSQALGYLREERFSCIRAPQGLRGDLVTSLFEDHEGHLWVGIDDKMTVYDKGRFEEIKQVNGASTGLIVSVAEDINHDIWLVSGPERRRVLRVHDRRAQELSLPLKAMPHEIAADPRGGLWLGLMDGELAHFSDGQTEVISFGHTGEASVQQLAVDPDGTVLAATGSGLLGWRNGTRRVLTTRNGLPCDWVSSLVTDAAGSLWLSTRCGYVEISRSEQQKWWSSPNAMLSVRVLDSLDGAQSGTAPFQGSAKTPDGRLWFVNENMLQMIDPRNLNDRGFLPPVHLEEFIADQVHYPATSRVALPALTRNLEIDYAAPSFAIPQRVRFRYILQGRDVGWQYAGARRQAFYSDLRPGAYTFRVMASDDSGAWGSKDTSVEFSIAPAFYQTWWFYALCTLAFVATSVLLYTIRMRRVAALIRENLEARLAERERIARELHDTLLQGVQGLILRFQAASMRIPPEQSARRMMEQSLDRADQLLVESRQKVKELRPDTQEALELSNAIVREGEQLSQTSDAKFSLIVRGSRRELHPIVNEEGLLIAREALTNAFRHSAAKNIEVKIVFGESALQIGVRDDGKGISPAILEAGGKAGHFGLRGMKERSEGLGGSLEIRSKPDTGTEIELRVPRDVAYRHPVKTSRLRRLFSLFWSRTPEVSCDCNT